MITLAGRSFGGSRSYSGGSRSRSYSSRPRAVIHNHVNVTHVHVYGGYRRGGWGYGYYGPRPYFAHWYGYPVYYGNPVHWSGWDWPLALLIIAALVLFLAWRIRE